MLSFLPFLLLLSPPIALINGFTHSLVSSHRRVSPWTFRSFRLQSAAPAVQDSATASDDDDSASLGFKITMPALSKTMKEGRILRWLVEEGDLITTNQPLFEVETDKADMDVQAFFEEGYLAKILVEKGETVPIETPVALIACCDHEIDHVIAMYEHSDNNYAIPTSASSDVGAATTQ